MVGGVLHLIKLLGLGNLMCGSGKRLQSRLSGQVLRSVRWQCAMFYLGTLDIDDLC